MRPGDFIRINIKGLFELPSKITNLRIKVEEKQKSPIYRPQEFYNDTYHVEEGTKTIRDDLFGDFTQTIEKGSDDDEIMPDFLDSFARKLEKSEHGMNKKLKNTLQNPAEEMLSLEIDEIIEIMMPQIREEIEKRKTPIYYTSNYSHYYEELRKKLLEDPSYFDCIASQVEKESPEAAKLLINNKNNFLLNMKIPIKSP